MDGPRVEMPQPKSTEVRYPGYKKPLLEVTTAPSHVAKINEINNALDAKEYDETGAETTEETLSWLKGGSTRKFSSIRPESSKRALIGIGEIESTSTSEMVIGLASPLGELSGYIYIYDHKSPIEAKYPIPEGSVRKEISFVTDQPDDMRDPNEMAEAIQQSAMMLWEIEAGITIDQLSGSLTPEQLARAKKLEIFTTAGDGDDETNYRKGLYEAGFRRLQSYLEDSDLQHVYALDIDALIGAMAVKKDAVSQ